MCAWACITVINCVLEGHHPFFNHLGHVLKYAFSLVLVVECITGPFLYLQSDICQSDITEGVCTDLHPSEIDCTDLHHSDGLY